MKTTIFRLLLIAIVLIAGTSCQRNDPGNIHIIPRPSSYWDQEESFQIKKKTRILYDYSAEGMEQVADYLRNKIKTSSGLELESADLVSVDWIKDDIILTTVAIDSSYGDEGYKMQVRERSITIQANTPTGIFYGVQTLLQLLPPEIESRDIVSDIDLEIPCVQIWDKPEFSWRGMHLDVARHYFSVAFIKKFLDYMAMHKMNVFHWHLTEDQGWRLEIDQYPELTEIGAWRINKDGERYGGFYTKEEVKEIIDYANERFITIVPEIEMPGHCQEVLAAYPDLSCTGGPFEVSNTWGVHRDVFCAGKEETFEFLENVLDEVIELFPGEYIHIGGDECPKVRWENCPDCQRRIRKEGLTNEHELQSYFVKRMEKYLNEKGKKLIGWDEILEGGLAPEATVMSWRGMSGGVAAAKQGHDVVMSPTSHCYFDYYQGDRLQEPKAIGGYTPLEKVYDFNPVPGELNEEERKHILGGQANVWTEYIATPEYAEYMMLPRMSALAEVLWTHDRKLDYDHFLARMKYFYPRLDVMNTNYRIPEPLGLKKNMFISDDASIILEKPMEECEIYYTIDDSDPDTSSIHYVNPIDVTGNLTVKAITVLADGRKSAISKCEVLKLDKEYNGLQCEVYSGRFKAVPDFDTLTADKSVTIFETSLEGIELPTSRFALNIYGLLEVPENGEYEFRLTSDDGSLLNINDKLLINNDSLHTKIIKTAKIQLDKGLVPINIRYFESTGNEYLDLSWKIPGQNLEKIHPKYFVNPGSNKFTRYVNPFIGTGGHGHTFPGATMPFGMVQLSPDTRKDNWDGCSGYHYSDGTIAGFSMTHLSGTGVGDYGDFKFMPVTGKLYYVPGDEDNPEKGYRSRFSHETEIAKPGYYHVYLSDYDVEVDLTVGKRTGLQKYTFPKSDKAHILVDLREGATTDKMLESEIKILNDHEIMGFRRTSRWAADQYLYMYAEFSKPFKSYGIVENETKVSVQDFAKGENLKAFFDFDTEDGEEILVKIGISAVSAENAKLNAQTEIPDWKFYKQYFKANKEWNNELGKIEVKGGSASDMTKFYTALYHCFIAPNLFSDVNGEYRGHDLKVHQSDNFEMHTVFSLWDTFRALHPLFTIIQQDKTNDLINSMLDMYEKGGLLPVWELAANETGCMIGYHSIPVIADAYAKGIRGYDADKALEAMIKSSKMDNLGLKYLKEYGYIPAGKEGASVSKTLEYAYDDWCIAEMAYMLDNDDVNNEYLQRAQYYKNLYDPSTGFIRGKINGMFVTPFNPTEVNFMLTEANTWQYNFFVPQDIEGLKKLMGGNDKFISKLDEMFNTSSELSGRHQSDITGLVGQYAHGNEPSHHMAYLYNYAGEAWKTQKLVRKIMDELYTNQPDGYCGNEDCGQMSAWYVLSAMGFYPVVPGSVEYVIGSPAFDAVTIHLENGKDFRIVALDNSPENVYVNEITLNGRKYHDSYITQDILMKGGEFWFKMAEEPNKDWGSDEDNWPHSAITDELITPVPFIQAPSKTFTKDIQVSLHSIVDAVIYYTIDGSEPTISSAVYKAPITFTKNNTIKAFAVADGKIPSKVISGTFNLMPEGRKLTIKNKYNSQYTAGGDIGLIDQLRGGDDFRTGFYQGYEGVDLDAVLDLGKAEQINSLGIGFVQDEGSWIWLPIYVEFYGSQDGKDYKLLGKIENEVDEKESGGIPFDFKISGLEENIQFIRIFAKNRGVCPGWHVGDGNPCWIFADEILINK